MTSAQWDAAVIGAGVIGLSCALELSRRGWSVVLLERDTPGAHASRVAAGLLGTAALPAGEQTELLPLKRDSLARYSQFIAHVESLSDLDAGYHDHGTLWVARDADEASQLDALHSYLDERGLKSQPLSGAEAAVMEPNVADDLVGGLLIEDDVQVDPRALLTALVAACEASGVTVRSGCAAEAGARQDDRWSLTAGSETISAEQVVVTAGPWCDAIRERESRDALAPIGVGPVKGQLLRLRGRQIVERVVRTDGVTVAQRRSGELIAASTKEPEAGWDLTPTDEARDLLLERAARLVPAVADFKLEEHSVGLRPALDDRLPLIGNVGDDLWVATGHYQHGILLAPSTAHWLAEAMESGETPELLAPFAARTAFDVTVNGDAVSLTGALLTDALCELGYDPEQPGIAVALNMSVVPRSEWVETVLANGDRIDIVGARQGG